MQLQGKKPTQDFLSLYTESSPPVQHRNTQHSSQGYALGMHNFLKPLELTKQCGGKTGNVNDGAIGTCSDSVEHVLLGDVGTFSIRQGPDTQLREEADSYSIGRGSLAPVHDPRMDSKPETYCGSVVHGAPSTTLQDSGIDPRSRDSTIRAEGRSSGSSADHGPSGPRSKHSATEQRRRTKINDRLQILRELLPHCDQKRDKASFLLEVIEYIRFLQEKVQKYESADPERNHKNSKSMPWAKAYYRSCWNTQNISQVMGGGLSAPTQDIKKEQSSSNSIAMAPVAVFGTHGARETGTTACASRKVTDTQQDWAKDSMPQNQPPWLSMSMVHPDHEASNAMLSKQEGPTFQDDTHSLSSAYSQGLLTRLTEALKKSGVDPSQVNISVEINMDRRAGRPNSNIPTGSKANEGKDPNHVTKRLRCDNS